MTVAMDDLRDAVTRALDSRGFLSSLKAELRLSVFEAVDEAEVKAGNASVIKARANPARDKLAQSEQGSLALALVLDVLASANLVFTQKILEPELGAAATTLPSREAAAAQLGLPCTEGEALLCSLLYRALNSQQSGPTQSPAQTDGAGGRRKLDSARGAGSRPDAGADDDESGHDALRALPAISAGRTDKGHSGGDDFDATSPSKDYATVRIPAFPGEDQDGEVGTLRVEAPAASAGAAYDEVYDDLGSASRGSRDSSEAGAANDDEDDQDLGTNASSRQSDALTMLAAENQGPAKAEARSGDAGGDLDLSAGVSVSDEDSEAFELPGLEPVADLTPAEHVSAHDESGRSEANAPHAMSSQTHHVPEPAPALQQHIYDDVADVSDEEEDLSELEDVEDLEEDLDNLRASELEDLELELEALQPPPPAPARHGHDAMQEEDDFDDETEDQEALRHEYGAGTASIGADSSKGDEDDRGSTEGLAREWSSSSAAREEARDGLSALRETTTKVSGPGAVGAALDMSLDFDDDSPEGTLTPPVQPRRAPAVLPSLGASSEGAPGRLNEVAPLGAPPKLAPLSGGPLGPTKPLGTLAPLSAPSLGRKAAADLRSELMHTGILASHDNAGEEEGTGASDDLGLGTGASRVHKASLDDVEGLDSAEEGYSIGATEVTESDIEVEDDVVNDSEWFGGHMSGEGVSRNGGRSDPGRSHSLDPAFSAQDISLDDTNPNLSSIADHIYAAKPETTLDSFGGRST